MMDLPLKVDFTSKVVVVTGAGGILCGTMAKAFAQAGAKVAALDLNEESVKELANEIKKEGYVCEGYQANVLEQEALEESIAKDQAELDAFEADTTRVDQFLALTKKYTDFSVLTTPMILEFVDKIVVHAPDRSSGERMQEVDIYLKFIGKFDVPLPEPTPEELAEQERLRKKREKQREYSRRSREKKKRAEAQS